MANPFVVIRYIFIGLITYFNLMVVIIGSWHVKTVAVAGLVVPAAALILIVLAFISFIFVAAAIAPLIVPTASTAQVKFECWWTFLLATTQAACTIALTVDGPMMMCRATPNWSVCASSSILFPSMWLASLTVFAYFLTLLITCISHMDANPALWFVSIYSVPWFSQSPSQVPLSIFRNKSPCNKPRRRRSIDSEDEEDNIFFQPSWTPPSPKFIDEEAANPVRHRPQSDPDIAPWAREVNQNTQRGRVAPFTSPTLASKRNLPSLPPIIPIIPTLSARPITERNGSSRYIEHVRESQYITRSGAGHAYMMTSPNRGIFPELVDDDEKPIPLPRLSTWIRADHARGITMQTIPVITPIHATHDH